MANFPWISGHTLVAIVARATPVGLVLIMAITAFEAGTGASDRPGIPDLHLAGQIYYALGLFLLGGMDLGVPRGGPAWAQITLWGAYFLAPAVTTTAVAEGVLRAFRPARFLPRRDHLVVIGLGRIGSLYARAARLEDDKCRILGVDPNPHAPGAMWLAGRPRSAVIPLDGRSAIDDEDLGISLARGVVVSAGDDLVSLDIAWRIAERYPRTCVAVHVADIGLRRGAGAWSPPANVRILNAHEIAAAHLYAHHLGPRFQTTEGRDVVILGGFGRFGQTMLQHLLDRAVGQLAHVVLVDRRATALLAAYQDQVGRVTSCPLTAIDADVADPTQWPQVFGPVPEGRRSTTVIVLATDDTAVNLRAATGLRRHAPGTPMFVRVADTSAYVDHLAAHVPFVPVASEASLLAELRRHFTHELKLWG